MLKSPMTCLPQANTRLYLLLSSGPSLGEPVAFPVGAPRESRPQGSLPEDQPSTPSSQASPWRPAVSPRPYLRSPLLCSLRTPGTQLRTWTLLLLLQQVACDSLGLPPAKGPTSGIPDVTPPSCLLILLPGAASRPAECQDHGRNQSVLSKVIVE